MKKLLNELDATVGKTAYQSYTLSHGIERLTVLVPLKNSKVFEEEFQAAPDKSKSALLEIVGRHAGKIKG